MSPKDYKGRNPKDYKGKKFRLYHDVNACLPLRVLVPQEM